MDNKFIENQKLNLKEFHEQKKLLQSLPTRAWLSLTGRCNLQCLHCPRTIIKNRNLSSYDMDPDLFQRIENDLLPMLALCRIGGNNLGEQLCCKRWDEYLEKLAKYPFTPWLITNGQLLTANRIRKLVENDFSIDFSIDAATEEKYSRIRGARLEKLIKNVAQFARERQRQEKTRCKITFAFTVFQENIDDLPNLLELAAEIDVDQITVIHFMPTTEEQRYQSLFYHQNTANEAFNKAEQLSKKLGITLLLPPLYPFPRLSDQKDPHLEFDDGSPSNSKTCKNMTIKKCFHPWTSASINENGEVYPCCQSNLLMGSLKSSSFKEIWNNKKYQKLRKTVNSNNPMKHCRDCPLRGNTLTGTDCENNEYFLRNLNNKIYYKTTNHAYLSTKAFLKTNRLTKRIFPTIYYLYKK
jgi:radical SAM protein with 4Fe4S-binding SPASM domain